MMVDERKLLDDGLARLGLDLETGQRDALLHYLDLIRKWNKVYNLTSRRETENMVSRHLLDSLAVLPYINGSRVIDVGTGAGLPGIPLAIADPSRSYTLLDCVTKKARFRTQAKIELGLDNVTVVDARAESFDAGEGFDTVISRAFASIADMLQVSGHMAAAGGKFLAMKGIYPEDELAQLPAGYRVETSYRIDVPKLNAERHLIVIVRA